MAFFAEYDDCDATALASLIKKKAVSRQEVLEACLERVQQRDPALNAIVHLRESQAHDESSKAKGKFAGVPFLLKDLIQMIAGEVTTHGAAFWQGFKSPDDTELFARFKKSGLVTVGRTNCPELGLLPHTESAIHGTCYNPWDLERTPGGSSGGSAAAVAARIVPIAGGGDGGGSIRIPASCCGLVGLKPTRARTPAGPFAAEVWNGFESEFAITRSVRDCATLLDEVHGPGATPFYYAPPQAEPFSNALKLRAPVEKSAKHKSKRFRIAVFTDPPFPCDRVHSDCLNAVKVAAGLCEDLGHDVEIVDPGFDKDHLAQLFMVSLTSNVAANIVGSEYLAGKKAKRQDFEDVTWLLALVGRALHSGHAISALQGLQAEAIRFQQRFGDYDVIINPVTAKPAVKIGELNPSKIETWLHSRVVSLNSPLPLKIPHLIEFAAQRVFRFAPYGPIANITGQPSISLPLYWTGDGLPVGTMFTSRFGDESTLLTLAAQLEKAQPWAERKPPMPLEN